MHVGDRAGGGYIEGCWQFYNSAATKYPGFVVGTGKQQERSYCSGWWVFFLISLGGQAPHEMEMTAAHRVFYRPLFQVRDANWNRRNTN